MWSESEVNSEVSFIVVLSEGITSMNVELFSIYNQSIITSEIWGFQEIFRVRLSGLIESSLSRDSLSFEHFREGVSSSIGVVHFSDVDGVVGQVEMNDIGDVAGHEEFEDFTVVF